MTGLENEQNSFSTSARRPPRSRSCLFTLYTGPIGQMIKHHQLDCHTFADDSQLYVSFKINDLTDEKAAFNTHPGMCERTKSMAES